MNQLDDSLLPQRPDFFWLIQKVYRLIAFGFGSGLAPVAPGTFGTLLAWLLALIVQQLPISLSPIYILLALLCGLILGIWVCGVSGRDLNQADHGGMVWDEMIAFWLILLFILPSDFYHQALAFVLFRFFDAVKPGPISSIDGWFKAWQPDQQLGSTYILFVRGFGVMIDDLAAALATLWTIAIIQRIFY